MNALWVRQLLTAFPQRQSLMGETPKTALDSPCDDESCEEQEILRLEGTSRQSECIRQRWGLVSTAVPLCRGTRQQDYLLNAFKLIPPGMLFLR